MSNQSIFSMLYGVHSESSSFHPDFARLRALRLSTSRLWRQNFRRFWSKVVLFLTWPEIPIFFWLGWVFWFWISVLGLCCFMFLNNLAAAGELLSPTKVPWCYWLENFQSTERSWTQMVALVARRVSDFFCPFCPSSVSFSGRSPCQLCINGLVDGKIYRKPWFLPWHIGLSCRFSLKPIQWMYGSMVGTASPKDDSFCHPLGSSRSFRFAGLLRAALPSMARRFRGMAALLGMQIQGFSGWPTLETA